MRTAKTGQGSGIGERVSGAGQAGQAGPGGIM